MRFHRLVSLFALGAVAVGAGTLVTRAAGPSHGSTESATEAAFAPDVREAKEEAAAPKREAKRGALVPVVGRAEYFGVTPAVRDLAALPAKEIKPGGGDVREILNLSLADKSRRSPIKRATTESGDGDAALFTPATPAGGMPPPIATFEALSNADNGPLIGGFVYPPDTNGDIGPNHYVQTVNLVMRVYNRAGVPQTPVFLMSSLFASIGGPCAASDDGDPIVLYDHLSDRWLISQFAFPSFPNPPYYQCIVVSQTADPTGAYFAYGFTMPGANLNDYPHFGVWPDAYYMTDNQFLNAAAFNGGGAFAFDRAKMLAGDPTATFIYFDLSLVDPNIGGQLPSDLDGPPRVRPNIFAMFTATEFGDPQGDGLRLWEFAPNFATPASSTFTELPPLPVAAFDPITPAGRADIPQPGTAIRLDSIGDRIMHRLQYRNFGTYESLVTNHTVDASGDPGAAVYRAAVRYYELRRSLPAGAWTVREQSTFAPADGIHRWMGSAAMDNDGNLAVGFSVSDATATFPGIRYAGRLANDPTGLAQGEATMTIGSGVQTGTANRWGDYSMLGVDPLDDCTFWYTQEYYSNTPPAGCSATICWQTRVGSFRFPTCTPPPANGTITGTVTDSVTTNPIPGALVTATGGYSTVTNGAGVYTMSVPPGTYDVTASKFSYSTETNTGVVVVSGLPTTSNFALDPAAVLVFESRAIDDSNGNNNGNVDPDECIEMTVVVRNTGSTTATNVNGTLSTTTPGVTVTGATSAYADIGPGATVPNTTPFEFQTSPTFVAGTVIDFTLNLTSNQGNFTLTFTVPSGTPNPAATNFNATGPVPIPDLGTANLPVTVSGITTSISKVRVATRITHTWDGDLQLRIIGPDNTTVLLANGRGGSGDNFGTDCPADDGDDTIFDDAAATAIAAGTAPFVGSFRPEQPLSAFIGKSGAAANGTWTFRVNDTAAADVGNIECVTIIINDFLAVSGGGPCGAALSINDVTTPESGNATFNVTLSEPAPGTVTVAFTTADGTATAGADYTATSGTLTFAAGDTIETVTVPILPDALDEADETFNVNLSGATGAGVSDPSGVGTITDDDLPPNIIVGDVAAAEGNTGTTTFTFPVTLSAPSGRMVTVHFDTSDGTATAPSDYADTNGDLTFQVGETAVSVLVNVVGDTTSEPNETFNVDFTNPVNASLPDAQAVGTINNDDRAYFAVQPCRLHDTRQTTPINHNTTRNFAMTGACLIPANATAVHIIVTTVRQTHFGDLRAWPAGQPEPTASIINYQANTARANNAIMPLGAAGEITIKAVLADPSGRTDVVLDVLGYFN